MREAGYIRGGTEGCCIIGFGDRWYDESRVRYINDEPARHKMCNLIVSTHADRLLPSPPQAVHGPLLPLNSVLCMVVCTSVAAV